MKQFFFTDEWKEWIWSNIKNGVSKQRIYDDLIEQDYDAFLVMNELRFIPEIIRKKDEVPPSQVMNHLISAGAQQMDVPIPFFVVENFLSAQECHEIVALQKSESFRSTVGDGKDCRVDDTRTSFTTYFESLDAERKNNIIQQLKEKIELLAGIPAQFSEKIQGQWYKPNGFYHNHFDACDNYNQFKYYHGNRTWTCMITLNEVEEGGATYFPELDQRFQPAVGRALIWYNLGEDGLAHSLTLHTGEAVIKGEKFIVTQWFHQCAE